MDDFKNEKKEEKTQWTRKYYKQVTQCKQERENRLKKKKWKEPHTSLGLQEKKPDIHVINVSGRTGEIRWD